MISRSGEIFLKKMEIHKDTSVRMSGIEIVNYYLVKNIFVSPCLDARVLDVIVLVCKARNMHEGYSSAQ